jgi:thiamine biosynthesis protein ThiS
MDVLTKAFTLTLNGEARTFDGPLTVAGLVDALGLDVRKVAVELNREIVPRSAYAAVALRDGDVLEIVHFIGGG